MTSRAVVTVKCIRCGACEKRDWPIPYGVYHIYAGVCKKCKSDRKGQGDGARQSEDT